MHVEILYEDPDLAIIAKPAGVVVNNAETNSAESIQEWWLERLKNETQTQDWASLVPPNYPTGYGTPEEIFADRGGIVHRLDKETSGVMLLAKNPGSLLDLLAQFQTRQVQKQYQCLVHGKFQVASDTIDLPLGRSRENRLRYMVLPDGRSATTTYQVTQYFPHLDIQKTIQDIKLRYPDTSNLPKPLDRKLQKTYQGFSLVSCWPKTGRTHQIRVHLSHLKHPIVSDEIYLGQKRQELDRLWCPRLFLHAGEIQFTHPRTHEKLIFSQPLPADLAKALTFLQLE